MIATEAIRGEEDRCREKLGTLNIANGKCALVMVAVHCMTETHS